MSTVEHDMIEAQNFVDVLSKLEFELKSKICAPDKNGMRKLFYKLIAHTAPKILRMHTMRSVCTSMENSSSPFDFINSALKALQVSYTVSGQGLLEAPSQGPLIIVSNHPFGMLEGLILASAVGKVRTDIRFLANYFLSLVPEVKELFFAVDPFDRQDSKRKSLHGLRQALSWVRQGGALAIFPSGEVSHLDLKTQKVTDPLWHPNMGKLIQKTGANVLPVRFFGRNSLLFQLAGLVHPRLRTILLPHEMLKKQGQEINLCMGKIVPASLLQKLEPQEVSNYLKARCESLVSETISKRKIQTPVAAKTNLSAFEQEKKQLQLARPLAENKEYAVYCLRGNKFPHILQEIGRQREITFRQIGEGSGKDVDLDIYDHFYDQLILWHKTDDRLAGGYRIGKVDKILSSKGLKGLYSSSLFKYRRDFFQGIENSLELGRSFVTPNYQKEYSPLLMLWKGIGNYVLTNSRYRYLIGPVSISQEYGPLSLQLIMKHLNLHFLEPELAAKVKGRRNPKFNSSSLQLLSCLHSPQDGVDMLDKVVQDLENGKHGVPVLIRQYLRLGGKITAFHHDQSFGSIDGLMQIDLLKTDRKMLSRVMGKTACQQFLDRFSEQQECA